MGMRNLATVAVVSGSLLALVSGCGAEAPADTAPPLVRGTSAGLNGLLTTSLLFLAADADKDAAVTRDELRATAGGWFTAADTAGAGSVTAEQLAPVLDAGLPMSGLAAVFNMGGGPQPRTPDPATVEAMMAALPSAAPARPAQPRKVLVLARAAGFVHSSIPLAAATIEALGNRTGAWSTTITYDAADITTANLEQYDAIFLASTTGAFLDDPDDAAVTAARRQALLDFVRGGKGLAGIHAATDSYHASSTPGAGAGGNPFGAFSAGGTLGPMMVGQGDRNGDARLDRAEVEALADAWFDAIDVGGTGRLGQSDFALFALYVPQPVGDAAPPVAQGPDDQVGTWPEFNRMIGGYFKFHWLDPQKITVKIDDPGSPLTSMFNGQSFDVYDETYTMGINSWSRDDLHVLTSIDYESMSPEDRALEEHPRPDGDYGLSWIRREGQGRVFYEAHGHSERVYAMPRMLEHLLAGMQYVLGDLEADDSPGRP